MILSILMIFLTTSCQTQPVNNDLHFEFIKFNDEQRACLNIEDIKKLRAKLIKCDKYMDTE
jgi:hypothetical protein